MDILYIIGENCSKCNYNELRYSLRSIEKYGKNNYLPERGKTAYKKFLAKTREECEKKGVSIYYSSLHRNMHMSKVDISECREYLDSVISDKIALESFAYLLNYRYTVKKDFDFKPVKDVKLCGGGDWWKADSRNTECFSTADFEPGIGLDCLIGSLFSNKSKYEL